MQRASFVEKGKEEAALIGMTPIRTASFIYLTTNGFGTITEPMERLPLPSTDDTR